MAQAAFTSTFDFALRRAGAKILEKSKKFPKFQRQIRKAGGTEKVPPLGSADIFGDNRKLRFGEITALLAALRTAGVYSTSRCLALEITERWLRPKSAASARAFSMLRGAAALICSIILGV